MKKIITSASIVALGAASLSAAYAPGLTETERSKFWSVSASLRGFYDDNFLTQPKKEGSAGIEVNPSVQFNFPMDQTLIKVDYMYGMRWYSNRDEDFYDAAGNLISDGSIDNTHHFDAMLKHAFTEDYRVNVNDSFVVGQEPGMMNPKGFLIQKYRAPGNNIYNGGSIDFDGKISRLFGFSLGYDNELYDYDHAQYDMALSRMEQYIPVELNYQALENTRALLGYQYGMMDYKQSSDPRNNNSHYMFIGADQTFNPKLKASMRVGAQYTTFSDAPSGTTDNNWTPYADAQATYTYTKGSYLQGGLKYANIASDEMSSLNQEGLTVYLGWTHEITAKLKGSVIGQYQHSTYNDRIDSTSSDVMEDYYMAGVNLLYQFNQYLSAEIGYNFDNLDSEFHRGYERNRAYIGVTASY